MIKESGSMIMTARQDDLEFLPRKNGDHYGTNHVF